MAKAAKTQPHLIRAIPANVSGIIPTADETGDKDTSVVIKILMKFGFCRKITFAI
jgi:hypothetical protein